MPRRDRSELLQDLPRLRRNFEASRQLAAEAVERARRLAQETDARKRLLETAATESKTRGGTRDTYIWEAAARELLRAARERDRELGVVAHELRQSLGAAIAADRLLTVSADSTTSGHAREVLSRQLAHLSELIENLLEYSRLSVEPPPVRQRIVNMNDLVSAAIETIAARADEKQLQVSADPSAEQVLVAGDQPRLRQALINLLHNAVRYTPERGRVRVAVRRDGADVLVRVQDTGEGIDSNRLDRIFDPFVRGSTSGSGLGIGLALVRRIAALHGGSVSAESEGPGRGSVFTLRLPIAEEPPTTAHA